MKINEERFPISYDKEYKLVPPQQVYSTGGNDLPSLSIGKPSVWSEAQLLDSGWNKPASGSRYWLLRYAFSLRPEKNTSIRRADFTTHLSFRNNNSAEPVFHDLYPLKLSEHQAREIELGVSPELRFSEAELSLASFKTTIDISKERSLVEADGVGENRARWHFRQRSSCGLSGSQIVYAIIEIPTVTTSGIEIISTCDLTAETVTDWGVMQGFLPRTERDNFSWLLNLSS